MESIYLLIEREFLKSNLPIYKIGRSSQENDKRIKQYPKGSRLICLINVEDSKFMEKEIISLFKYKYVQRRDIGSEYFEGNVVMMRKDIFDMVMEYDCVGFSECKKRQRGLKKLVLKELTKRINNSVTVVADVKPEISPIENIAVPNCSSNPIPTYISTGPYTCESCKYSTTRITLYKGHLKTKKHIAMQSSETSDGFKHICTYCSKKYVNITGLKKHKIKCASRIKHEEDIVLANQLSTRNEQNDLLAQQVLQKEEIKKEIMDELMKELFLRFSGQGTIPSLNR